MQKKTVTQYAQILAALMKEVGTADVSKAISVYMGYLHSEHVSYLFPDIV